MIRFNLILLFLCLFIQCKEKSTYQGSHSEENVSLEKVISVVTKYDSINTKDDMVVITKINDTSLIDLTSSQPQYRPFEFKFTDFDPKHTYAEYFEFHKSINGDEYLSDTVTIDFKFTTRSGKDTVLRYEKVFYASNNHTNFIGDGKIIDGKKQGRWVFRDKKTKDIHSISYYENDLKNGLDSIYDESYLAEVNSYKNGLKHGKQHVICHDPQNDYKNYICSTWFFENGNELDTVLRFDPQGNITSHQKSLYNRLQH